MKVLLQTTIPFIEDDWHIGRFSLLERCLAGAGHVVSSRDKDGPPDSVLSRLDETDFDQMWLFAVDVGTGLTVAECEAITRFRKSGRGLMVTRDHEDLGSSICTIGGIGASHYFHSRNPDPDETRRVRDDTAATNIDWPNYHSGWNGEYQRIRVPGDRHPLLAREDGSAIEWFPAHPHEGAVGEPPAGGDVRVVATGTSTETGRDFNLVVAFERDSKSGRGISESSFHHFCDYNWDPRMGCPSFVADPERDDVIRDPSRLADIRTYVLNAARWLSE